MALEALNFFIADMQAGIGPFLGVFLQQPGWATGAIGLVMSLGGAGMAVTAPAGALIHATSRKRLCVIASGVCTVLASALIFLSQTFSIVAGSQIASAVAGAAIGPAVAGITLGVGQRGFNRQNGRNQAFNHAGNMVGAALSGVLGWNSASPPSFGSPQPLPSYQSPFAAGRTGMARPDYAREDNLTGRGRAVPTEATCPLGSYGGWQRILRRRLSLEGRHRWRATIVRRSPSADGRHHWTVTASRRAHHGLI